MKTSISLCAMTASILALSVFTGCDAVHQGGTASHGSRHNYALGTYHSTPEQVRIARERAKRHYARLSPGKKKTMRENGVRYLAVRTLDPSPDQLTEIKRRAASGAYGGGGSGYGGPNLSGPPHQANPEHKPWHCVMIWDTYAADLVGSDCYAVTTLPPKGESARFDTHVAEYIGTGEE